MPLFGPKIDRLLFGRPESEKIESLKRKGNIKALRKALYHSDEGVWYNAFKALESLDDPEALVALVEASRDERLQKQLTDRTPYATMAAWHLWNSGDRERLSDALRVLMSHRDPRVGEVAAEMRARRADTDEPEEATRVLLDEAIPIAGEADWEAVHEQFLGWQDSDTVYTGSRTEVEPLVVGDLRHMRSEPGFLFFRVKIVESQNAAEVHCLMGSQSRVGREVAVPVRVWCTQGRYAVSGLDPSWKEPFAPAEVVETIQHQESGPEAAAPAREDIDSASPVTRVGPMGEKYCSERCYELGGQTVARHQIQGWVGDCSVCRGDLRIGPGQSGSMVCYRPGLFLYFHQQDSCVSAVRAELAKGSGCVVCGQAVA